MGIEKQGKRLPNKRWLPRAVVLEFLDGGRRELERLEAAGLLVPEYPAGIKHKRYVRAQVQAAIDGR